MRIEHVVLAHDQRRAGGTHSLKFRVLFGILSDTVVGGLKTFQQRGTRPIGTLAFVNAQDRFNRQVAGFLAALITAHAVRDDRQATFALEVTVRFGLPIEREVFVVLATATDIALTGHFDPGPDLHRPHGELSSEWAAQRENARPREYTFRSRKKMLPEQRTHGRHLTMPTSLGFASDPEAAIISLIVIFGQVQT